MVFITAESKKIVPVFFIRLKKEQENKTNIK